MIKITDQYTENCQLCLGRQLVSLYSDWICHKCGQEYHYVAKGVYMIVLSREQIEILRVDAEHRLKIMMP